MKLQPETRVPLYASKALRACAVCCLVAGALTLGAYSYVWAGAHFYQAFEAWRFDANAHGLSRSPAGVSEAPAVKLIHSQVMPDSVLGRMKIPRIGISVMVLEGDDGHTLRFAAGHVPYTALPGHPGNVAIAGHRDTFFRALRNIRKDDTITFKTATGYFEYRVQGIWVVAPEQVEVLDPTARPSLTLITCFPFHFVGAAPYRFIVRARQIAAGGRTGSDG
jgi:sortase A